MLDHVSVADWPAVIEVGLTDRVTVGIGAGGALDPLPPQACSARAMRAAAVAVQGCCIRKLVRIGDMLPRPSGVLGRRRPHTIQRAGIPTSMESCGGTPMPRVNSHTARRAPRKFYFVTHPRSNAGAFPHTSMESCGGTPVPRVNSHAATLAPREVYSVTRSNFRDGLRTCASRDVVGTLALKPLVFNARLNWRSESAPMCRKAWRQAWQVMLFPHLYRAHPRAQSTCD